MLKSSEILAKKLKDALSKWGAQTKFIEKTGLTGSQLAGYIKGTSAPTLDLLDRIADGFGVHPSELLKEDNILDSSQFSKKPEDEKIAKIARQAAQEAVKEAMGMTGIPTDILQALKTADIYAIAAVRAVLNGELSIQSDEEVQSKAKSSAK